MDNMEITIKRLYNSNKKEIGIILTACRGKMTIQAKNLIEEYLENYVSNNVYLNELFTVYKESKKDIASITVIKDINALDQETVSIP